MAASQLGALMKSDQFRPGCFARIDKFILNTAQNKDIVILLDVTVVGAPRGLCGAPTSYPDGAPLPGATTAALGSLPDSKKWHLWRCMAIPDYEDEIMGTIGFPEVALTAGKWFYEILIVEKCTNPQFGWAQRGFDPSALGFKEDGWGCGNDAFSYGCDGETGYYVHADRSWSRPRADPDDADADRPRWSVGDIVGLLLDLDGREIRFSINGECQKYVFRSISVDSAYYPAMSMSSGVVDVNYGERDLKFLPEGYAPVADSGGGGGGGRVDAVDAGRAADDAAHHSSKTRAAILDRPFRLTAAEFHEREERAKELEKIIANPDPSGALYVLSLLDKLDEAARAAGEAAAPDHPGASGSNASGWRRASVEDYGRAMRLALEELAEGDRREIERIRQEHDAIVTEIKAEITGQFPSHLKYAPPP